MYSTACNKTYGMIWNIIISYYFVLLLLFINYYYAILWKSNIFFFLFCNFPPSPAVRVEENQWYFSHPRPFKKFVFLSECRRTSFRHILCILVHCALPIIVQSGSPGSSKPLPCFVTTMKVRRVYNDNWTLRRRRDSRDFNVCTWPRAKIAFDKCCRDGNVFYFEKKK